MRIRVLVRLGRCMLAGAGAAGLMAADAATAGRKTLAAQAAAGHESTTAVLATGGAVMAVLLGLALFTAASAWAWARRRRARAGSGLARREARR
jgi:hypothetical protein